jgi:ABC-type multidrug transport system fused ATPase/permease subunit
LSDVIHEEEALGKVYDSRLIALLWRYVKPYGWQVALTLFMVVPLLLAELAPAWIIKAGLDRVFVSDPQISGEGGAVDWILSSPLGIPPLFWLATLYLLVALLNAGLHFLHMLLMATTGQSAMRDLRRAVFAKIQQLPLSFFDRFPVGRLVTRATNDVENVAEMFQAGVVALITDVFKMVGFAVALFLVDAQLALVAFAVIPFLAIAAIIFRLKVREAFRAVRVRIARINAHIQETITGMKVVQLFTRETRNMRDFDQMNADHRDAWHMSIRYDALLFAAVEIVSGMTVAVIIWYGTGLAEPGVLYVFIDWMRRFFMPLRDLSAKYSVMQSSMASSERIFQLMETEVEIRDPETPAALPEPGAGRGSVEFENVWFAYGSGGAGNGGAGNGGAGNGGAGHGAAGDEEPDWVLRDLSFRVEPGDKVAFVGATGAGKTTVINLLSRFYEVTRGRILVDGVDIRDIPQADLRGRVATVLQDVFLFSGSVAENIALGRRDLSRDDVVRAAQAVEADRFISRLPEGYETEVRERGANFSAGQRQLLSFARALAHGADILVLDEATSSIDSETEALIQHGIHVLMEGKTAIAIAHRLSTIRDVDRIYVLHKGRLVESGDHDTLLARGGAYHRLYQLQAEGEELAPAAQAGV